MIASHVATELSVLILAYNEEENVPRVLDELIRWLREHEPRSEIVFIDDGSSDGTRAAATRALEGFPSTVVHHDVNRGMGAAIKTGTRHARGTWVTFLPADGQIEPAAIGTLRAACDDVPVTDGELLTDVLQEWAIRTVQAELPGYFTNARTLVLGNGNHVRTTTVLSEFTPNVEHADPAHEEVVEARADRGEQPETSEGTNRRIAGFGEQAGRARATTARDSRTGRLSCRARKPARCYHGASNGMLV